MSSRAAQLIVSFGLGVVATVSVSLGVRHRHRNVLRPPGARHPSPSTAGFRNWRARRLAASTSSSGL
jgi:hypothetical protein